MKKKYNVIGPHPGEFATVWANGYRDAFARYQQISYGDPTGKKVILKEIKGLPTRRIDKSSAMIGDYKIVRIG